MQMAKILLPLLALAALPAQASTVLTDDFEGEGGNYVPNFNSFTNWTVSGGTVDLLKNGSFGLVCRTGNACVDLDGSTGNAGMLTLRDAVSFAAGDFVSGEWYLSGNQRNYGPDSVTMALVFGSGVIANDFTWIAAGQPDLNIGDQNDVGSVGFNTSIAAASPFGRFGFSFTAATDGAFRLSIGDEGADDRGAILDDVSISVVGGNGAVPEPATWAMLITGFGVVGFAARRRRDIAVTA